MITVTVETDSPVRPFEQLRAQLADAIRSGALEPGTRLPTVRQLARDLGIAPNTVAKAYRSLDDEGLIQADGRRGTRVVDGPQLSEQERSALLATAAQRYLTEVRRLGLTLTDAQQQLIQLGRPATSTEH
jgi:DNA-binding transcriptional regulator YhcF (GntR family)